MSNSTVTKTEELIEDIILFLKKTAFTFWDSLWRPRTMYDNVKAAKKTMYIEHKVYLSISVLVSIILALFLLDTYDPPQVNYKSISGAVESFNSMELWEKIVYAVPITMTVYLLIIVMSKIAIAKNEYEFAKIFVTYTTATSFIFVCGIMMVLIWIINSVQDAGYSRALIITVLIIAMGFSWYKLSTVDIPSRKGKLKWIYESLLFWCYLFFILVFWLASYIYELRHSTDKDFTAINNLKENGSFKYNKDAMPYKQYLVSWKMLLVNNSPESYILVNNNKHWIFRESDSQNKFELSVVPPPGSGILEFDPHKGNMVQFEAAMDSLSFSNITNGRFIAELKMNKTRKKEKGFGNYETIYLQVFFTKTLPDSSIIVQSENDE